MRETKLYFYKVFLTNILENETPLLRGFQLLTRAGYPIPVGPGYSFAYPSAGLWNCCSEAKIAKPRLATCVTSLDSVFSVEDAAISSYPMHTGGFFWIFFSSMYCIQHCFICRPSDSTVSEDAGIEPRTIATLALAVRRFHHSARSHPQTRLDLIQCILRMKKTRFISHILYHSL